MDDTALYTATETGRALLEALDAEEPFRLLSTIPEKLQELCTIGGRRESTTRQLIGDITTTQSHNHELITSGVSLICEWKNELGSLPDSQYLQRKMDDVQESLEELRDTRQSDALPRRYRAREKNSSDLSNELLKLQETNEQIQEISRYFCHQVEGLAVDEENIYHLFRQIVDGMGLVQGGCDACERDNNPSTCIDAAEPGPDEGTILNRIRDMKRRCEEVEAAITQNNDIIARQEQEIDRLRRVILS